MYYNFTRYVVLWKLMMQLNAIYKVNSYYYLSCKALLDHWELALYKYCIIIIIIKNNNMLLC